MIEYFRFVLSGLKMTQHGNTMDMTLNEGVFVHERSNKAIY